MWCKQCQQDVPGAAPTVDGQYACPRCARVLLPPRPAAAMDAVDSSDDAGAESPTAAHAAPQAAVRPWHVGRYPREERLRHTARVLARYGVLLAPRESVELTPEDTRPRHVHPPAGRSLALAGAVPAAPRVEIVERPSRHESHVASGRPHPASHDAAAGEHDSATAGRQPAADAAPQLVGAPGPSSRAAGWSSTLAWGAVSLAVAALSCGGVLACWAIYGHRPELWDLGLPVLIGGQVALALAAMLASDGPRTSGR
jgi:hypothetical protein